MAKIAQTILEIAGVIFPVFAVVGAGFILKKRSFLKDDYVPVLNKLTYNLGLSSLIFVEISGSSFSDIFNVGTLKVIISAYFAYIFIIFISIYFSRMDAKLKSAFIVSSYRNNMAFIGMSVLLYAFGSIATAKAGIVLAALTPIAIILTSVFLQSGNFKRGRSENTETGTGVPGQSENNGIRRKNMVFQIIKASLLDPVIIAAVAGLLVSYFSIKIPEPVSNIFEIFSDIAIPLALLAIGASFKFSKMKSYIRPLAAISILKLILLPFIGLMFCLYVFKVDPMDRNVICVLFSTPVAVATYIQSVKYETDHDFISSAIVISTIVSALTMSAWLFILKII